MLITVPTADGGWMGSSKESHGMPRKNCRSIGDKQKPTHTNYFEQKRGKGGGGSSNRIKKMSNKYCLVVTY